MIPPCENLQLGMDITCKTMNEYDRCSSMPNEAKLKKEKMFITRSSRTFLTIVLYDTLQANLNEPFPSSLFGYPKEELQAVKIVQIQEMPNKLSSK